MKLPTLYKKNSTGSIQYWNVEAIEKQGQMNEKEYAPMWGIITTRYGQVGTENEQITNDTITEGKNQGKKNETTAYDQAAKEAKSKWEKQKKKGYVETLEAAEKNETDDIIEGGVLPQLAHKFSEQGHKIKYPCSVQPKLDGIRCVAIIKDGECTLWSRTRKPIKSVPHIVQELEGIFQDMDVILDGELYNHEYKANFEKIVSLVRQDEPAEDHYLVQYHIYDKIDDQTFSRRHDNLNDVLFVHTEDNEYSSLRFVLTETVLSEDKVMDFFEKYRKQGYEGAMLRNKDSKYVNKRSYDLQKVKEFDDAEFEIVGIDEGRGKLAGHVGAFRCRMSSGKEFLAKMSGDTSKLRDYFVNHALWSGKRLTVRYQGLTGAEEVPRFPVGVTIRDYE